MPITVPIAPPEGRAIVEDHLSQLGVQDPAARNLVDESGGAPATPAPLPLWKIDLADLASGPERALASAKQVGWQYIIAVDGPAPIVELSADGPAPTVLSLIRGGAGDKLGATARDAEQVVDPTERFEARILDLRNVGQIFLWLQAANGADRLFDLGDEAASPLELAPVLRSAANRARQKLEAAAPGDGVTERGGA